jgi:hypothetical protein
MQLDYDVDFSRGPATVTKWKCREDVVIAETILCADRGVQVPISRVGRASFCGCPIRKIVIPSGVQLIEEEAFAKCPSIDAVIFAPRSALREIAMHAFYASGLRAITIPKRVEVIGESCFEGCAKFGGITFETGSCIRLIESRCFAHSGLAVVTLPRSIGAIGPGCFSGCLLLQTVTFEPGGGLKVLERSAAECSGLGTITIPKSVTALKFRAFAGCRGLSDVLFEPNAAIEHIDSHCFSWSALVRITIPRSVAVIGEGAFDPCARLSELGFERGSALKQIQISAFAACPIARITFPQSVELLGQRCFFGCKALGEVLFEPAAALRQIDESAFEASGLTAIVLPGSVEVIGRRCFADCRLLVNLAFAPGVRLRRFEEQTFRNCAISMVCLPKGVTVVGDYCFADCTSLTHILFEQPSQLKSICCSAFADTRLRKVDLPSRTQNIDANAFPDDCAANWPEQGERADPGARPVLAKRAVFGIGRLAQPKVKQPKFSMAALKPLLVKDLPVDVIPARPEQQSVLRETFPARTSEICQLPAHLFEEVEVLGEGAFGVTRVLRHKMSHMMFVAKELPLPRRRLTPQLQEKFSRTIELLSKLRHPCLSTLVGSFPVSDSGGTILMPYIAGKSLHALLDEPPAWWSSTVATIIILGMTLGLRWAHNHGLYHGSLKPSNVIVDGLRQARVCDFGALYYQRIGIVNQRTTEASLYIDQDITVDDSDESAARSDVYAFGVILYEMVMIGKSSAAVLRRITLNKLLQGKRPELPTCVPPFMSTLIEACWADSSVQRPAFDKVYEIMESHGFMLFGDVKVETVRLYVDAVSAGVIDSVTH